MDDCILFIRKEEQHPWEEDSMRDPFIISFLFDLEKRYTLRCLF